jgi:pimeloyl-ACP methyl ester carboxylesterase
LIPDAPCAYSSDAAFSAAIDEALSGLEMAPFQEDLPRERSISALRRERGGIVRDDIGVLTLVEEDGLLHWEEAAGVLPRRLKGRRGFWGPQKVVKQLKVQKLGFSEVARFLETFDRKLTPYWGLRRWDGGHLKPAGELTGKRPILLFVHGTFSKSEAIFEQLQKTKYGTAFLAKMHQKYEILAFDHPTLSISPMINALDLGRVLGNYPQPIDVICHSRGGLVTRWWLETFDSGKHGRRRAVLVGAPLDGTSLAAPDKLRNGIDLLTNLGHLLGEGMSLIPYLTVAGGLLKIVSSFGSLMAKTPAVDAAVAAVPGLAAMSRINNNFELQRLNTTIPGTADPKYFAVASNFAPIGQGWKFWRNFARCKDQLAHLATDRLIFNADSDLVVDTESMFRLAGSIMIPDEPERVCRFHDSPTVHHTNYFLQAETLTFIDKVLS